MIKIILLILLFCTFTWGEIYYFDDGDKVHLNKLKEHRVVDGSTIEYYENQAGQKMGVKKEILVKCKEHNSCQEIFKKYNLKNIESLTSSIFLITIRDEDDIFELSQKLYLEDNITHSHPNFIKKRQIR